jgi:hypothetical protein
MLVRIVLEETECDSQLWLPYRSQNSEFRSLVNYRMLLMRFGIAKQEHYWVEQK